MRTPAAIFHSARRARQRGVAGSEAMSVLNFCGGGIRIGAFGRIVEPA
jgi:hypothetical protein